MKNKKLNNSGFIPHLKEWAFSEKFRNALPKDFALKHNNSYALRRKLFGKLEYFWKIAYMPKHFDKVVLRTRFRLDDKLLTLYNCKTNTNTKHGNKIFKPTSNDNGAKWNKKDS